MNVRLNVYLYSNGLEEDAEEYKRKGANTVLLKPIDSKIFEEVIRELYIPLYESIVTEF
jgi:hypothetical protein